MWSKFPLSMLVLGTSLLAQTVQPTSVASGAAEKPAILHARGVVSVDGQTVPETSPLFINQKVETHGSTATLNVPGGEIDVATGTWMIYRDVNSVELGCGTAEISSKSPVPVVAKVGDTSIVTGPTPSRIMVTEAAGRFRVDAIAGSATVVDGSKQMQLKEGDDYQRSSRKECPAYVPPPPAKGEALLSNRVLKDAAIIGGAASSPFILCAILHCWDNSASDPKP